MEQPPLDCSVRRKRKISRDCHTSSVYQGHLSLLLINLRTGPMVSLNHRKSESLILPYAQDAEKFLMSNSHLYYTILRKNKESTKCRGNLSKVKWMSIKSDLTFTSPFLRFTSGAGRGNLFEQDIKQGGNLGKQRRGWPTPLFSMKSGQHKAGGNWGRKKL